MQNSRIENLQPGAIWKGRFDHAVSLQCRAGIIWLTRGNRDIILERGGTISLAPHDDVLLQALGDEAASFAVCALDPPRKHPLREALKVFNKPLAFKTKSAPF